MERGTNVIQGGLMGARLDESVLGALPLGGPMKRWIQLLCDRLVVGAGTCSFLI